MFGIGSTELLVILLVALIVLGPKSLASFSRKFGRTVGEFRKVSHEFQRTLNVEVAEEERATAERQKKQGATAKPPQAPRPGEDPSAPPQDSPLAQALARTKAAAEAAGQPFAQNTGHEPADQTNPVSLEKKNG